MIQVLQKSVVTLFTALFLCPISIASELQLDVGDIVLRSGINVDSIIIQKLSNSRYSHIGVITQIHPTIIVVHATTDDNPEKPNQVIETSYETFIAAEFSNDHLVIRPNFLSSEEKHIFANAIQKKVGEPYVLKSKENDNLYCTTLLEQPLITLRPNILLDWQNIDFGPFHGEYLFPDAFIKIEGIITLQLNQE